MKVTTTVLIFITVVYLVELGYSQSISTVNAGEDDLPQPPSSSEREPNLPDNTPTPWARSLEARIYLVEEELQLYTSMKMFRDELEQKLRIVSSWLADFEETSPKASMTTAPQPHDQEHVTQFQHKHIVSEITGNPLAVLRMIRRFSMLDQDHELLLQNQAQQGIKDALQRVADQSHIPDTFDYEDAIYSILILAETYNLPIQELMSGKIADVQTHIGLTIQQVHEIALYAEKNSIYTYSYLWLVALREHVSNSSGDDEPLLQAIDIDIDRVTVKHDRNWNLTKRQKFRFSSRIRAQSSKKCNTCKSKKRQFKQISVANLTITDYLAGDYQFQKLCRGETTLTEKQRSTLICYYASGGGVHARWRLSPLKVEVHSWSPYIIQYYDAIPDKMLEYIEETSTPEMEYAKIINHKYNESDPTSQENFVDNQRVSTSMFLGGGEHPDKEYIEIERRVADITGLEVNSGDCVQPAASECAQVAAYSTGGHYRSHMDSLPPGWYELEDGNRMATFMIYLNNVIRGGATAFPIAGVSVRPVKKSAVFWYNLFKNGEEDERTRHGGCPMLLGQKKISNFWIRSFANFQKRKCGLNSWE